MSTETKRNRRSFNKNQDNSIPTPIVELAATIAMMPDDMLNKKQIQECMKRCHPLHDALLNESKTVKDILETLPHLLSYNGQMVSSGT